MSFHHSVVGLLAILVVAVAVNSPRPAPAAPETTRMPVRVAHVSQSVLAESLADPTLVAQLFGLESRGSAEVTRAAAELARGEVEHVVLEVADRGEPTLLVVLAE